MSARCSRRLALAVVLFPGCESATEPESTWTVVETDRGVLALTGDWVVGATTADPGVGVVSGVDLYYRGEPVGGGGLRAFPAEGIVWNAWVPMLLPVHPVVAHLGSVQQRGDTLHVAFSDTIGREVGGVLRRFPLDVRIVPAAAGLEVLLDGIHLVFLPIRASETYAIRCIGADGWDHTVRVGYDSPNWWRDVVGPARFEIRQAHMEIDHETDAPLTKIGVGNANGGERDWLVKLDLDHSFNATPPAFDATSRLTIRPTY